MMMENIPVKGYLPTILIALFYGVIALSMGSNVHFWVLLLCGCVLFVRLSLYFGHNKHTPKKRTVNLLAVLSAIALLTTSGDLGLLPIMINLLILACSLKLMLIAYRRDFYQLIICATFLVACGFILYQSLFRSVFYALALIFLFYILLSAHAPYARAKIRQKRLAILLIQALPVAVLLFVFLPRLPPLWKMPEGKQTETGLSETMTPGDIAKLTKSDKLAFTATFDQRPPAPQNRYWRAFSLESFDGKTWTVSDTRHFARRQLQQINRVFTPRTQGVAIDYEIILEPTQKQWLVGLDTATPSDSSYSQNLWQGWDYQLSTRKPVFSRYAYALTSYPNTIRNQGIGSLDSQVNLQVPEQGNEETVDWVAALRQQHPNNQGFAKALMAYFKHNDFEYTLTPPPMTTDPVDSFLFTYKAGFCAHYASAMAYAFRLAGIPARIVSGYQGGTALNDNTLSIYQYDAHAWVEAWIDENGWQQFDPTTMVAPSRVNGGFEHAARYSGELIGEHPFNGLSHQGIFAYFSALGAKMDYMWSRWFLGFNEERQTDIFKHILGKLSPLRIALLGSSIILLIIGLLTLYFMPRRQRAPLAEHQRNYLTAVQLIEKFTGIRREDKSARRYFATVKGTLPDPVRRRFLTITEYFEHQEYDAPDPKVVIKTTLAQLKTALKNTKPILGDPPSP
ncbi:DUF3488 and transglutaminase-like domain-containing protein [Alteromonas sp. C1M14]|uniref:transglutaminase family protein n=1 Tax=Alteromonas sp. C1M14 TaxID=2841567 RepID=UPI001C09793A|nr:DUF3488 and transglutaminase-like domain-containing protein [Alteromonas sp. C1M14]MBU2978889.1 DUF3488 and transglutaminase-like domain-containing protein [Alteromonas sp. C1M14]